MKKIIMICIGVLIINFAYADEFTYQNSNKFQNQQRTAQRTYAENGHYYIIHFLYDTMLAYIPATYPEGKLHYDAVITVNEVIDGKEILIATFGGQYTHDGCFEDDPKYLVETAIKIRNEKNK